MEKKSFNSTKFCLTLMLAAVAAISIVSCKKYDSLGYTPGAGAPTITSVHTWSVTDTSTAYDTVITYDASGNVTQTLKQKQNRIIPFDSATTAGNLGDYYIIYGTNLGNATSITFNGYSAFFNRALMTDGSIVVQLPSKTPYLKPQATDSLVITTLTGKASYYFEVIPPPPTVSSVSDYDFVAGSLDTLYGVGFASVNSVFVKGIATSAASAGIMTQAATIKYQTDTVMVIQFPSTTTTLTQGNLLFAYTIAATGANDTAVSTSIVLNDLDNAYQILGPKMTADPSQTWAAVFQNNGVSTGWVANGWSDYAATTSVVHNSAISFYGKFDDGGWKVAGFQFNSGAAGSIPALAYDPSYQYLSFYVINTGASVAQTAYIQWGDNIFGQNKVNPITIQPGGWQFFKIPISSLNWNTGSTPWSANSSSSLIDVAFFLTCQNSSGVNIGEADLYFTNVVLIK